MMGSSTHWYLALSVLVYSCQLIGADSMCNTVDWTVDWGDVPPNIEMMEPFQKPGEIISGVTVRDVLELLGLAWNAPSWQEILGLVCVNYGPIINEMAGNGIVRRECEPLLRTLSNGQRINIYDACIRVSEETGADKYLTSSLDLPKTGDEVLDKLGTTENISSFILELLKWLGPSPFSLDGHGVCSALRILLSKQLDDIIAVIKNICVNPMAIILETLRTDATFCGAPPGDAGAFLEDLLDDLRDSTDMPLCRFLASDPTQEDYVERAKTIIDNIENFLTDRTICEAIMNTLDEYEFFRLFTGSSRRELCNQVSNAFSPYASYNPTPYTLPAGQSLGGLGFLDILQEILQSSFQVFLYVTGAFLRSDTLADGLEIYCDVFETVLNSILPSVAKDISTFCDALQSSDLEPVEDNCLNVIYQPPRMDENIPIPSSVRMFTDEYIGVIVLEFARQLFNLTRLSQEDVCLALDTFCRSDHNLQSVTRLAVDVWLTEVIPMVHRICEDYDESIEYFKGVYERKTGENFVPIEQNAAAFILTHTGFSSRTVVCQVIYNNIDQLSGRSNEEVVKRFEREVLAFLTNEERCAASLDAIKFAADIYEAHMLVPGYNSTSAACGDLAKFFTTEFCGGASSVQRYSLLFVVILSQTILAVIVL